MKDHKEPLFLSGGPQGPQGQQPQRGPSGTQPYTGPMYGFVVEVQILYGKRIETNKVTVKAKDSEHASLIVRRYFDRLNREYAENFKGFRSYAFFADTTSVVAVTKVERIGLHIEDDIEINQQTGAVPERESEDGRAV